MLKWRPVDYAVSLSLVLTACVAWRSFFICNADERVVETRFGRIVAVQSPGFYFKWPTDSVITYSLLPIIAGYDSALSFMTADGFNAKLNFVVSYNETDDTSIAWRYANIRDTDAKIASLVNENFREEIQRFNMLDLSGHLSEIRKTVEDATARQARTMYRVRVSDLKTIFLSCDDRGFTTMVAARAQAEARVFATTAEAAVLQGGPAALSAYHTDKWDGRLPAAVIGSDLTRYINPSFGTPSK